MKLHRKFHKLIQHETHGEWVTDERDLARYTYEVCLYEPTYTQHQRKINVSNWEKAIGVAIGWMLAHGVSEYSVSREEDGNGSVWDMLDKYTHEGKKVGAQIFKHEVH